LLPRLPTALLQFLHFGDCVVYDVKDPTSVEVTVFRCAQQGVRAPGDAHAV
jgi:hypothetical protein